MKSYMLGALIAAGLGVAGSGDAYSAGEDDASLAVKPNRCIALRQGQYCYQKLQFSWETSDADDRYCLYTHNEQDPLICWVSDQIKHFTYKFKSTEDIRFLLKNETQETIIDETSVVVAWVYKRSKKVSTGWRLF